VRVTKNVSDVVPRKKKPVAKATSGLKQAGAGKIKGSRISQK